MQYPEKEDTSKKTHNRIGDYAHLQGIAAVKQLRQKVLCRAIQQVMRAEQILPKLDICGIAPGVPAVVMGRE
jgi:hypothetical protein